MGKVVLLLLLALVAWLALKAYLRRGRPAKREAAAEDMVSCERCGVNLPRSLALTSRGRFYCSEEHRTRVRDDSSRD